MTGHDGTATMRLSARWSDAVFAALTIIALLPAMVRAPLVPSPFEIADQIRSPLTAKQREVRGPVMTNLDEVFNPANYPFWAKAGADEGRVRFLVSVDARGTATECEIIEAAEAETLNQPTCDLIMAKGKFVAARDRRGRAVASTLSRSVVWVLENRAPLAVIDSHERVVLTFDGAGKADCRIEASADVEVDPRACDAYLAMPMVRSMAASRAALVRAQMARYATVSEQSSFIGPDAAMRAAQVGKRPGEDLNDRTITRVTIDSSGKVKDCTVVEQGMGMVEDVGADGKPDLNRNCERMALVAFEASSAGGDRVFVTVSAAYYRER